MNKNKLSFQYEQFLDVQITKSDFMREQPPGIVELQWIIGDNTHCNIWPDD